MLELKLYEFLNRPKNSYNYEARRLFSYAPELSDSSTIAPSGLSFPFHPHHNFEMGFVFIKYLSILSKSSADLPKVAELIE